MKLFACFLNFFWLLGCSTLVKIPENNREVSEENALAAWNNVLKKFVNQVGQVDFYGLKNNPDSLTEYVRYVTKVGPGNKPESFPTQNSRLAHYINSYNALSMYNILDSDIPKSLSGFKKIKFFYFKKFIIAGEKMSLYTYENEIIRKQGDERVHFALNCMSRGCPRLPQKAFTAQNLDKELEREAFYFFSEERNAKENATEKKVYLSEILDFFPEDFLKKSPSLVAYANRYRPKSKLNETFKLSFFPYDWTVNTLVNAVSPHT